VRYALALDLHNDIKLIEEYEHFHRAVWPEVIMHLRQHGVLGMEIFRLGTRLFMVLDTDDARYDVDRLATASLDTPRIREWEELMWRFQVPTPWTPAGQKWTLMTRLFDLRDYP
jgi:L-rhamnose mutarotase